MDPDLCARHCRGVSARRRRLGAASGAGGEGPSRACLAYRDLGHPRRLRSHHRQQDGGRSRVDGAAQSGVRLAEGMALPGDPARRQRRAVPAADRQALLRSRPRHPQGGRVLSARPARRRVRHRRHVAPDLRTARRPDQLEVRQVVPRPADEGPQGPRGDAAPRIHARGGRRGHRARDGAREARGARRQSQGSLPFLYRARLQHRGRAHHFGERRQGGKTRGAQERRRAQSHREEVRQEAGKESRMKICVAGQGAFGQKHLDALKRIPGVEITSLVGGNQDATAQVAKKYGIPHHTGELSEGIKRADAVILTTPTKLHFRQGEQVMRAGKHVLVEIPVTDSVEDAENLVKIARETGVTAMGGHVRRFNPSHQYVHKKIEKGELKIQQMDVQTYFFRRKNMNAAGQPRSWTDHLLWHHAAHTIDLFQYQTGETISDCYAVQGPQHPELKIAMDMGIVAKVPSGAILTLSLSFNNDGPLGSFFRYIGDTGTYLARYDDLFNGKNEPIDVSKVDVSMDGIELEDREFIAAIKEKRAPNGSLEQLLPCMRVLGRLEQIVDPERRAHA